MENILYALQQRNLVYNADFRYFSNANYGTEPVSFGNPDGWFYSDSGKLGSLSYQDGFLSIQTSNDSSSVMQFKQALHEFPHWSSLLLGKKVSAKIHAEISSNCLVTASLADGVHCQSESWQSTNSSTVIFDLSLNVSDLANGLFIKLESASNAGTIKISKIYANIGDVALAGLSCMVQGVIGERKQYVATENAPAEEMSLCLPPKELSENESRLDSVINGRFGVGSKRRSLLPDMRGYFSRSWDNGAQTDPNAEQRQALGNGSANKGDHVGTRQSDEFKLHKHEITFSAATPIPGGKESPLTPVNSPKNDNTTEVGGDETRAKNIAELFTIKWS